MESLIETPEHLRNLDWDIQFLNQLFPSQVDLLSKDPQSGPDGFPYLFAEWNPERPGTEPVINILKWLSQKGIGMVVNPFKPYPDYVLTYGMIWSYIHFGYLFKAPNKGSSMTSSQVYWGKPTEQYLPRFVRNMIREFLHQQNIFTPKISLITQDQINFDLAFSLESLNSPPDHEHKGIAEALGWFLPPHYSIVLIKESDLASSCVMSSKISIPIFSELEI